MTVTYDVIVLGLGGFGSSALYHLARRGVRVLGIERFSIGHDRGSSHGDTRIIRKAYFEHPDYVPLLQQAYRLWEDLEQTTGRQLYSECGLILAGPPDGETITGALNSARLHGITVEVLSESDRHRRDFQFRIAEDHVALYEPEAGYLRVEDCVRAHIEAAQNHGATVLTDTTVHRWKSDGGRVRVETDAQHFEVQGLVVAGGAWSEGLLARLELPLAVIRKVQFWHEVYDADWIRAPAYFFELSSGCFYGFPSLDGRTIKLAEHTGGERVTDPLGLDRCFHDSDLGPVSEFVRGTLRNVAARPSRHAVCMYTMSPDGHFIVDRHPEHPNVILATGFSGHGFKFTSAIGLALADLALDGKTTLPIEFLSIHRPALRK